MHAMHGGFRNAYHSVARKDDFFKEHMLIAYMPRFQMWALYVSQLQTTAVAVLSDGQRF